MSTLVSQIEIEYPESDGKRIGETDWHINVIIRLRDMLRSRYRDQRVYVGSDLMVYYVEKDSRKCLPPDVFVVLDCDPKDRAIFETWQEGRSPDVVFEISSRSTARDDQTIKPQTYRQLGVKELFLFDPLGEYFTPQLQGFRFVDGEQVEIEIKDGQLSSEVLGVHLSVQGFHLRLVDESTGQEV